MAANRSAAIVLLALVVICCSVRWGQAASDCTSAIASLSGCSSYLTNPSSTPDQKTCCSPLELVLTTPSSFQCLCAQASNSGTQLFKNALGLPAACKLPINVSEANCTTSTSTTPSTSSMNSTASSPNAGFLNVSPTKPVLVTAIIWSLVSLFA